MPALGRRLALPLLLHPLLVALLELFHLINPVLYHMYIKSSPIFSASAHAQSNFEKTRCCRAVTEIVRKLRAHAVAGRVCCNPFDRAVYQRRRRGMLLIFERYFRGHRGAAEFVTLMSELIVKSRGNLRAGLFVRRRVN